MSQIDALLYINLEHRKDRDIHIRNELHKLCLDETKIHRIDAIKADLGILGCVKSHIKALEYAARNPEWNTILIVEDDFTFKSNDSNEIQSAVDIFLKNATDIDVGLLSHHHTHIQFTDTLYSNIKRMVYSQTTSSYIIKKHYISTLLANFTESMIDMSLRGVQHENCLDIHWNTLIKKDVWYGIYPSIGYQYECYSDIQNGVVNYGC
jgi:glycosyl transferase family 25